MIAWRLERAALGSAALAGAVTTAPIHDRHAGIRLDKGTLLHEGHRAILERADWDELHLVRMEAGDLPEGAAGVRVARAVAGPGVEVGDLVGGQWPLLARARGILQVDVRGLAAINASEDLSVYTLYDGQVVEAGEAVARAKVIPFVVAGAVVEAAEDVVARSGPPVAVLPFANRRVAAVVLETLGDAARRRFEVSIEAKVGWFGGTLLAVEHVAPEDDAVTTAIGTVLGLGADLVVVAGTRAMDPLDPAFAALDALDAMRIRRGVPAHPGSLCWVAQAGRAWVIGVPSCGLLSQATIFDLVLTWVFAQVPITGERLAALGHGGFLTRDMSFRFPPYRAARERGAVE